eukprot:MONOS_13178.1-p1 / transcript=MONOS_13178.1 / gene=MONOS_13178 / organism=Monocercomonoides_exilis_PA203 / gene_product=unspecified product / transcript_product=unspecified product / location=Mono_scaffold00786:23566-24107(-) / protein_length=134 / sequence_SO=supercontig / SO=protein_coding / is_pseudo=false
MAPSMGLWVWRKMVEWMDREERREKKGIVLVLVLVEVEFVVVAVIELCGCVGLAGMGDERGERGVGDGEGGSDWEVCIWKEIVWGGEDGEGEEGWLRDDKGEVGEEKGAVRREEKWMAGICVDLAGGGEDGGS